MITVHGLGLVLQSIEKLYVSHCKDYKKKLTITSNPCFLVGMFLFFFLIDTDDDDDDDDDDNDGGHIDNRFNFSSSEAPISPD